MNIKYLVSSFRCARRHIKEGVTTYAYCSQKSLNISSILVLSLRDGVGVHTRVAYIPAQIGQIPVHFWHGIVLQWLCRNRYCTQWQDSYGTSLIVRDHCYLARPGSQRRDRLMADALSHSRVHCHLGKRPLSQLQLLTLMRDFLF